MPDGRESHNPAALYAARTWPCRCGAEVPFSHPAHLCGPETQTAFVDLWDQALARVDELELELAETHRIAVQLAASLAVTHYGQAMKKLADS